MKRNLLLATCIAAILSVSALTPAETVYATIVGQKSGAIKGSMIQAAHKDQLEILSVEHSIVSPRDPQSGLPTGQRMHKPFVFRMHIDKATPLLYNVLCTNENVKTAQFDFYGSMNRTLGTTAGVESKMFSVKLTNANIASITLVSEVKAPGGADARNGVDIEVAMTYQKIEWTWNDGGITAGDDWEARV